MAYNLSKKAVPEVEPLFYLFWGSDQKIEGERALDLPTERQAHWNNEAKPLQVWLDPPDGWPVENHVLSAPLPPEPVSEELRTVEFELLVPAEVPQGTTHVTATAFYYVCEDRDGTCLYRRQDLEISIPVQR